MKRKTSASLKSKIMVAGLFLSATNSFAQNAPAQPALVPSIFSGYEFYLIAGGLFILLLVIYGLGKTAVGLSKAGSKLNKK
jgi:hypothetical protein